MVCNQVENQSQPLDMQSGTLPFNKFPLMLSFQSIVSDFLKALVPDPGQSQPVPTWQSKGMEVQKVQMGAKPSPCNSKLSISTIQTNGSLY